MNVTKNMGNFSHIKAKINKKLIGEQVETNTKHEK